MTNSIHTQTAPPNTFFSSIGNKLGSVATAVVKKLKGVNNAGQNVKAAPLKTHLRREGRATGGLKTPAANKTSTTALSTRPVLDHTDETGGDDAALLSTAGNHSREGAIELDDCRKDFQQASMNSLFEAAGKNRDKLQQLVNNTTNEMVKSRLDHIATTYHMALQGENTSETTAELNGIITKLTDMMLSDKLGRKSIFGSHQPSRDKEYQKVRALENRLTAVMDDVIGQGPSAAANLLLNQTIKPFMINYIEQQLGSTLTAESRHNVMEFIDGNAWRLLGQVRSGIETYQTRTVEKTYRAIDAILVAPHLLSDFDFSPAEPALPETQTAPPIGRPTAEQAPPRMAGGVPTAENNRPPNDRDSKDERGNTGNIYNTYNNFVYSPTNNTYSPVNMFFPNTTMTHNTGGIPATAGRPDQTSASAPPHTSMLAEHAPDNAQQRRASSAAAMDNRPDEVDAGEDMARRLSNVRIIEPAAAAKPVVNTVPATDAATVKPTVNSTLISGVATARAAVNSASFAGRTLPHPAMITTPKSGAATTHAAIDMSSISAAATPAAVATSKPVAQTAPVVLTNQGRQLSQLPRKAPQVRHFNQPMIGAAMAKPAVNTVPATGAATAKPTVNSTLISGVATARAAVNSASFAGRALPHSAMITTPKSGAATTHAAIDMPSISAAATPAAVATSAPMAQSAPVVLTNQGRQLSQLPRKLPQVRHFNRPMAGAVTTRPAVNIVPAADAATAKPTVNLTQATGAATAKQAVAKSPIATAATAHTAAPTRSPVQRPISSRLVTSATVPPAAAMIRSQPVAMPAPQFAAPLAGPRMPLPAGSGTSSPATGASRVILSNEGLRRPAGRTDKSGGINHRVPLNRPAESLNDARARLKKSGPGPIPKWLMDGE